MARSMRLRNGLTQKEDAFAKGVVQQIREGKQINGTEIALKVYDTKDKRTAGDIASTNLNKPQIKDEIEKVLERNGISLDTISSNLAFIANSRPEKVSADAMVKSNLELLKLLTPNKAQLSVSFKADLGKMSFDQVKDKLASIDTELNEVMEADVVQ